MLLNEPKRQSLWSHTECGNGMEPEQTILDQYLIVSTQGGLRAEDGTPVALGYHTGHWEIGLLVKQAAANIKRTWSASFCGLLQ